MVTERPRERGRERGGERERERERRRVAEIDTHTCGFTDRRLNIDSTERSQEPCKCQTTLTNCILIGYTMIQIEPLVPGF